jgi:hypothetical protein
MMPPDTANPPRGTAGAGMSLLGGSDSPAFNKSTATTPAQRPVCPIIAGCQTRLVADLLAESVEIAIAYGTGILRAVREADDAAILENFRGFDAAARTARRCAEQLRAHASSFIGSAA